MNLWRNNIKTNFKARVFFLLNSITLILRLINELKKYINNNKLLSWFQTIKK